MEEAIKLGLLFLLGIVAGLMNVSAGGGSTLTIPALIFIGMDSALANGTNRVAIFLQNVFAVISFKKEKHSDFKLSFKMAACTIPGGLLGAWLAVEVSDQLFRTILGIVMIGVIISMFIPRKKIEEIKELVKIPWLIWPAMFGIGFYGGFIQVGVGFILMAAIYYILKINLVKVNMHKVFIVLIYTIPALLVFFLSGNVDLKLGLVLAAGNSIGGWWAAKLNVKKGETFIRYLLIAAILVMTAKMFGLF